jgi:hypothetical protein
VRREGGGRQAVADVDPTLVADLERIVEPATMGDPERVLKWVSKSPAKLADALRAQGHEVSPNTVSKLLEERLGYSRQVNRKTHEGASHPDRNAQFEHINVRVVAAIAAGQPVISVDTKKLHAAADEIGCKRRQIAAGRAAMDAPGWLTTLRRYDKTGCRLTTLPSSKLLVLLSHFLHLSASNNRTRSFQ